MNVTHLIVKSKASFATTDPVDNYTFWRRTLFKDYYLRWEESVKTWQRFIDTVRFKEVDHVPVALLGTPRFFASLAGVKLFECLHDPCKLMEAELQAFRRFPIAGLVSPEAYKEFFFPFHCLIREKFREHILVFHCDTKSDHILELLAEVGIDVFNLGPTTDIVDAKKRIGRKVSLMGNIDPVNILQNKDSGIVRKAVEECLKAASTGGRYILSAGGGMNENIPSENIDIMIESVQSTRSL